VFGAALIVLAAFYSRVEGPLEAARDGIKLTVKAVERLALARDLHPTAVTEAVESAIDRLVVPSRRPAEIEQAAEAAATKAVESVTAWARTRERKAVEIFVAWLAANGFNAVLAERLRRLAPRL
jgi:hypothetical protein